MKYYARPSYLGSGSENILIILSIKSGDALKTVSEPVAQWIAL